MNEVFAGFIAAKQNGQWSVLPYACFAVDEAGAKYAALMAANECFPQKNFSSHCASVANIQVLLNSKIAIVFFDSEDTKRFSSSTVAAERLFREVSKFYGFSTQVEIHSEVEKLEAEISAVLQLSLTQVKEEVNSVLSNYPSQLRHLVSLLNLILECARLGRISRISEIGKFLSKEGII